MADTKKYKQYIFKDGDYREVVGSHTVSGGSEPVGNGDIEIRLDFAYDYEGTNPTNNLFGLSGEENTWSQDPRHQYLKITSTPITSEFEEAVKNGTGVIRFDYPIKTNKSNHDLHESGHKGFTRNLYTFDSDAYVIFKNPNEQLYKDAIIFLTEDDISTDRHGNKIIVKKFSMEEMSKMMIKFSNEGGSREFDEVTDTLMSDAPDFTNYNGRVIKNAISEEGEENSIGFFTRKFKTFNIGTSNNDNSLKSPDSNAIVTFNYLPLYKTYFPMFIQRNPDLDFDISFFKEGGNFEQYSLYAKRNSRNLSREFNYLGSPIITLGNLSSICTNCHNKKYCRDLGTKPRLAIINPDYENIGSDNVALSMWDKTYKQCEQMFSLRISSAYLDWDVNYFQYQTIIFAMRGQITEK